MAEPHFRGLIRAPGDPNDREQLKTHGMIQTPNQLFAKFERGEIERDELHAMLAMYARELIREMEEDHQNPAAAWIEGLLARQAVRGLERRHGRHLLREVLVALSEQEDFPPARLLWNASHHDVPLHCFLRIRREPVFRIARLVKQGECVELIVEHGAAGRGKATRQTFVLRRDAQWRLKVVAS
jgi:hypothetical protein